jgi:hypothetical protein
VAAQAKKCVSGNLANEGADNDESRSVVRNLLQTTGPATVKERLLNVDCVCRTVSISAASECSHIEHWVDETSDHSSAR